MSACRSQLRNLPPDNASHAGLLLSRYLRHPVGSRDHIDQGRRPGDRSTLQEAAISAAAAAVPVYRLAYKRWNAPLSEAQTAVLHTQGRLIVGLGGENVLETGLTLHHTYGVPYIPGSALKGLAAHYADQVWGAADPKWKKGGEYHKTVFGAQDDAGHITFHDAWITPESLSDGSSGLVRDVMTPHHPDYNAGKSYTDGPKSGQPIPPTDFDDPNPVTYLSVTGSFLVCVSPDSPGEQGKKWAALALQLLCEALENWGVGGKTSSGYGRMAKEADQKQPPPGMTSAGAPQTKRKAGTPVKVKILGPRPKGKGYRVQEEGRPEGILTLGLERAPQLAEGQIVDVLLHDDARPPQYRWPDPKAGATGGPAGKGGRQ